MSKKIWVFVLALCLVLLSTCALAATECEHKYDEKLATAVTTGLKDCQLGVFRNSCTLCGKVKYYGAYNHPADQVATTVIDATCTEPAKVGKVCAKCKKPVGELTVVPGSEPTGHQLFDITPAHEEAGKTYGAAYKEAKCYEAGRAYKACKCTKFDGNGYYKEGYEPVLTVLPKLDHTYTTEASKEKNYGPTCVLDEYIGQKCDKCTYIKYIAPVLNGKKATGHNYEPFTQAATCKADGYSVMKCAACDNEDQATKKVIPMDPNAHKQIVKKTNGIVRDAACTKNGLVIGVKDTECELCKKDLGYVTFMPTIEQHKANGTLTYSSDYKAATCTTPEQGKITCSFCKATWEATGAATGDHKYVENTLAPANCKEAAHYGYLCAVCYAVKPGTTVTYVEGSTPTDHNWNVVKEYSAATCYQEGKAWVSNCKTCGLEKNDIVVTPKKNHVPEFDGNMQYATKIKATCTEPELMVLYCKNDGCDQIAKSEPVASSKPLGHDFTKKVEVPATCQKDGYRVMGCSREDCKAVDENTRVILKADPMKHTYNKDAKKVVTGSCANGTKDIFKAYCTEPGCSWTGYYAKEVKHQPRPLAFTSMPTARCDKDVTYDTTCAVCNQPVKGTVTKVNHTASHVKNHEFPATCTEPAYVGTYCTICKINVNGDKVVVAGTAPKKHNMLEFYKNEAGDDLPGTYVPSCKEICYLYKQCEDCSYTEPVEKIEIAHTFTNDKGQSHTIIDKGFVQKYCYACLKYIIIDEDTKEPEGCKHVTVTVAGKAPTCSVPGLTEGKVCVLCDAVVVKQEPIPTIDHTVVDVEGSYAPTCTEKGWSAGKVCSVCNTVVELEKELAALGHKYDADGICTVCGEKDPDFADHHDHVYTKTYSFNDDFTKRVVTYTCTKCDHTYSEEEDF